MKILTKDKRHLSLIDDLLAIWEASVRATHHFLSDADIQAIRPHVKRSLAEVPLLALMTGPHKGPLGFMGVDGDKIEMLFIRPAAWGQGLGRRLIDHAVTMLGATGVDVNEQNPQGVGFYRHMGFRVMGRSEQDGLGNAFPVLHLQLPGRPTVPAGYALQHADPGHIPMLNAIELAAAGIFPAGSIPEQVRTERLPGEVLTRAMDQGRLWVALDQGKAPVGYALLEEIEGSALLSQMDVVPEHGRKGLGAALVRRVIRQVFEMGFTALFLTTFSHVHWNAPFYQKIGFVILEPDEQPRFIQKILCEERKRGMENRVAMRLSVGPHNTCGPGNLP